MIIRKFTLLPSIVYVMLQMIPTTVTAMASLTLQVPIKIPNMHGEVHQLKVSCQALSRGKPVGKGENISGHGGLGTHQVNDTREVKILFNSPLPSCKSYEYQCGFTLRHHTAGNNVFVKPLARSNRSSEIWHTNQPGATFRPTVRGKFSTQCPSKVPVLQMGGQG